MSKGSNIRRMAATFALSVSVLAPAAMLVSQATPASAGDVLGVERTVVEITPKSHYSYDVGEYFGWPPGSEICTDWTNEDGTHGTNCP